MLGTNIKRLRTQRGLSRAKLANELRMTGRNIEYIENGKIQSPRLNTLQKLAYFFNMSIDELIK